MYKIALINCYFGKIRKDFKMWLNSCANNLNFDFYIFSDIDYSNYEIPENVKVINMTFDYLKEYIQKKFDFKITLNTPYKICDYKVAYGYIFEPYLKGYDFWGYCDNDMIFGNLSNFITNEILNNYEKIYKYGHLSIYRNNELNNRMFMLDNMKINYKDVFSNDKIYIFDETPGIYQFYKKKNIKIYEKNEFIDILNSLRRRLEFCKYLNSYNKKIQAFLYYEGKVFQVYYENNTVSFEEKVYIHFSSKMFESIEYENSYFITPRGFIRYDDRLENITAKEIKKMNTKKNFILDNLQINYFVLTKKIKRILKKI